MSLSTDWLDMTDSVDRVINSNSDLDIIANELKTDKKKKMIIITEDSFKLSVLTNAIECCFIFGYEVSKN